MSAILAIVALGLVPTPGSTAPPGFVVRSGSGLKVDGQPWRAIGVNVWDFNAGKVIGGDPSGCYYQHTDLDSFFDATFRAIASETGATAVRTFGFRAMFTAGGADWSATDKLLYYAQKHGIRLIPVFDDQYGSCGAKARAPAWYRSGYKAVEQPWNTSYRSYVVRAVRRYRASPAIAFWQLMNEAVSGGDDAALAAFSRDMVNAIRIEAGDAYHLINLGTAGGSRPAFDTLLSCSRGGGCNDLGTAHVYDPVNGLPGTPQGSAVSGLLQFWNDRGNKTDLGLIKAQLEGWTVSKASPPSPGANPYTRWGIRLSSPGGPAWAAYIDDVRLVTQGGVHVYSFEDGLEGFRSDQATLSTSTKNARLGESSLRVAVPSGATAVVIEGPPLSGPPNSAEAAVLVSLRAPSAKTGSGPAAMMNAAVAAARKPFLFGEAGYHAAVGPGKCSGYRSVGERAALLDGLIEAQLDEDRGSSGVLVWDWKDPALHATLPDGRTVEDPTLDCWSLTPGDPANAVLKKWATQVPAAPLPAPRRTWSNTIVTQVVLKRPPSVVPRGTPVPIVARLTRSGNPLSGVTVRSTGCAGKGVTDSLGHASFTCAASRLGAVTVSIAPYGSQCGCAIAQSYRVVSKRAIAVAALGSMVERGKPAPVTLVMSEPKGSLRGVSWRVPECGLKGTITSRASTVTIRKSCATNGSWANGKIMTFSIPETASIAPASVKFAGISFERMYHDASAGECIGLTPQLGWVGATSKAGACKAGATLLADSFVFQVPPSLRERAFVRSGNVLVASAEWRSGFRVDGRFDYEGSSRGFSAVIARSGGLAPAARA